MVLLNKKYGEGEIGTLDQGLMGFNLSCGELKLYHAM
mgnify:CR=1 FL=1